MKYNLILHTTTACNYDCSYCDVIKDNKVISKEGINQILNFIDQNYTYIERFKFFGGEPLLNWKTIKYIIDNSQEFLVNKYEIVTNTTLLNDEVGRYFEKYFKIIFFSIDSENIFDYEKNLIFIKNFNLENKLYFNLIVDPRNISQAEKQFKDLYTAGMRGFNILPVYFTKNWEKDELEKFTKMMKKILDISLEDKKLRLYGFTENTGENTSLINNSLFIDNNLEVFYSDIPSTYLGQKIKDNIHISTLENLFLKDLKSNFDKERKFISQFEKSIYNTVKGQKQLHSIMDYFSHYLNQQHAKYGQSDSKRKNNQTK